MFDSNVLQSGAEFSPDRKHRYALWRIWDTTKPLVMFIGLNPSTADEATNDQTIKRVLTIANFNGYGGVYMMNCFAFITKNPEELELENNNYNNNFWLNRIAAKCETIVFAWGSFKIVNSTSRGFELNEMFGDEAKSLFINKNGSPKHPLYCRKDTKFIKWKTN